MASAASPHQPRKYNANATLPLRAKINPHSRLRLLVACFCVPLRTFAFAFSSAPPTTRLRHRPRAVAPAAARRSRTVDGARTPVDGGRGARAPRATAGRPLFARDAMTTRDAADGDAASKSKSDVAATEPIAGRITEAGGDEESDDDLVTDDDATIEYPPGIPETFAITERATVPAGGFSRARLAAAFADRDVQRLRLEPENVTVPAALVLLLPELFPTHTKARKETRRTKILLHPGPLRGDGEGAAATFDRARLAVGKVADRVRPGDTLAVQVRMSHSYDVCRDHHADPPFDLPVVYQDDHLAVVDKPEGVVVFGHRGGGFGRHSVKACLAWHVAPPRPGTPSVLRRPNPVHRIDRGTSGLLLCAKTKPAMMELSRMFKERRVQKTYTAVVNGDILEPDASRITAQEAQELGVCVGEAAPGSRETDWQLIDEELEGQSAVTLWRPVRRRALENARNGTTTVVELRPKTGRYHQLRRHMAWVSHCPLLGDKSYDGGGLAKTLREQGFYLCSNKVTLEHPYYNTPEGRREWHAKKDALMGAAGGAADDKGGSVARLSEDANGTVVVHCEIELPEKFKEF